MQPPVTQPKYKCPVPDLGPCLWTHVPGGETSPAIVTRTGLSAVDLIVFPPESRIGIPKSGVIYVGDPRAKTVVSPEGGFWDFSPQDKLLVELESEVERLTALVESMSS